MLDTTRSTIFKYVDALKDGLPQEQDDAISLVYTRLPTASLSEEEYSSEEENEELLVEPSEAVEPIVQDNQIPQDTQAPVVHEPLQNGDIPIIGRKRTPPLPPSPISNPSSPHPPAHDPSEPFRAEDHKRLLEASASCPHESSRRW